MLACMSISITWSMNMNSVRIKEKRLLPLEHFCLFRLRIDKYGSVWLSGTANIYNVIMPHVSLKLTFSCYFRALWAFIFLLFFYFYCQVPWNDLNLIRFSRQIKKVKKNGTIHTHSSYIFTKNFLLFISFFHILFALSTFRPGGGVLFDHRWHRILFHFFFIICAFQKSSWTGVVVVPCACFHRCRCKEVDR